MAEVKNAFIKSKMNKDLDARLLPSGEYRDAQNVAISRSEGPNVGALETILGNELTTTLQADIEISMPTVIDNGDGTVVIDAPVQSPPNYNLYNIFPNMLITDGNVTGTITAVVSAFTIDVLFNTPADATAFANSTTATINWANGGENAPIVKPLKIIGTNQDLTKEIVYIFATDYIDESNNGLLFPSVSRNDLSAFNTDKVGTGFIYRYDLKSPTVPPAILVYGSWLNFAQNFPILNSNLLENLLFWTDNRNQPRVINVDTAFSNINATSSGNNWENPYYTNEDHVSVAKYAPYQPIELWKRFDQADAGYNFTGDSTQTTMRDVVSLYAVNGGTSEVTADYAAGASTININTASVNGFYQGLSNDTLVDMTVWYFKQDPNNPSIPPALTDTGCTVQQYQPNTGDVVLDGTLADQIYAGNQVIFNINPFYIDNYPGDPNFLEDKFVRFSYRFKYDDGEYSIFAPFTQVAFMSKQNGFFLGTEDENFKDEDDAYRSSVVEFMENQVTNVLLRIPMPPAIYSTASSPTYMRCDSLQTLLKVKEVDILYREAGTLPVKVLETIKVEEIAAEGGSNIYYEYNYQSRKPFKTLPESELIRVFDKIPVRAKSQEIISNRVVYGNYVDKLTPPADINYNVGISDKFPLTSSGLVDGQYSSIVEYPQHSVKHNRSYQVGIILSDRYGRQSSVILSSNKNEVLQNSINFGGSTLYAAYRSKLSIENESSVLDWPGDSLKIVFNEEILSSFLPIGESGATSQFNGEPGIFSYNEGDSTAFIPGGWHSYKVVVKQNEQEYYNVYLPGIINGYPANSDSFGIEIGETAFSTLLADNINKIPRDLSEVGPDQRQFRSSVRLFGRVENGGENLNFSLPPFNTQYYPGRASHSVDAIGVSTEINPPQDSNNPTSLSIYQGSTRPYMMRLSTNKSIGEEDVNAGGTPAPGDVDFPHLAVYETNPVISNIDIYWETSTTGYLPELNYLIQTTVGAPTGITNPNPSWRENQRDGGGTQTGAVDSKFITDSFRVIDDANQISGYFRYVSGTFRALSGGNNQVDYGDASVNPWFEIIENGDSTQGTYDIRIALTTTGQDSICYDGNSSVTDQFTFEFGLELYDPATSSFNGSVTTRNIIISLENVAPTITNCSNPSAFLPPQSYPVTVKDLDGINGCYATSLDQTDLVWLFDVPNQNPSNSITMVDGSIFNISASGVITLENSGISPAGSYVLNVILADANQSTGFDTDTCQIIATWGKDPACIGFYFNNPAVGGGPWSSYESASGYFGGSTHMYMVEDPASDPDIALVIQPCMFQPSPGGGGCFANTNFFHGGGYDPATDTTSLTTVNTTGTGSGLTVTVQDIPGGQISRVVYNAGTGSGYNEGDVIQINRSTGNLPTTPATFEYRPGGNVPIVGCSGTTPVGGSPGQYSDCSLSQENYIVVKNAGYTDALPCKCDSEDYTILNPNAGFYLWYGMASYQGYDSNGSYNGVQHQYISTTNQPGGTMYYRDPNGYSGTVVTNWQIATDIDGVQAQYRGYWQSDTVNTTPSGSPYGGGLINNTGGSFSGFEFVTNANSTDQQSQVYGGRYFAFNVPGEYKFISGRMDSTRSGEFTSVCAGQAGCTKSVPACCNGFTNSGSLLDPEVMETDVVMGDAYYDSNSCFAPAGQEALYSPIFSTKYWVSSATSTGGPGNGGGTGGQYTLWAQGYLTKYVQEFFTDKELTNKWTPPSSGYFAWRYAGEVFQNGTVQTRNDSAPNEYGNQWYQAQFSGQGNKQGSANTVTLGNTI